MMWWWSLSFVLVRYLASSLTFRLMNLVFIPERADMSLVTYIYGISPSTLLPLIVAMKYSVYINFMTLCHLLSAVVYPLVVFCGLLLFSSLDTDVMTESVVSVIF